MQVVSDPRYAPPAAAVADVENETSEVPARILAKIRNGWVAGLVSSGITGLAVLLSLTGVRTIRGFDAWALIDVALILGFTLGIYRKSRICAVLMLVYFIASKVIMFVEYQRGYRGPSALVVAVLFVYFYAQAVVGTVAYHRHFARAREASAAAS